MREIAQVGGVRFLFLVIRPIDAVLEVILADPADTGVGLLRSVIIQLFIY
jgi:hypothetical protein